MPPKSKRRKSVEESLKRGREAKQRRANTPSTDPVGLHSLFVLDDDALDKDSESVLPELGKQNSSWTFPDLSTVNTVGERGNPSSRIGSAEDRQI